jgi:hypothetical protein
MKDARLKRNQKNDDLGLRSSWRKGRREDFRIVRRARKDRRSLRLRAAQDLFHKADPQRVADQVLQDVLRSQKSKKRDFTKVDLRRYNSTMNKIITAYDIAKTRKAARQSITRLARQHKIGSRTRLGWIFSEQEAETLSKLLKSVGRPKKSFGEKARKTREKR